MRCYNKINNFFINKYHKDLKEITKKLNYSDDIINILYYDTDDEFLENDQYNYTLINSINKIVLDSRSVLEFCKDVIASWAMEDFMIKVLKLSIDEDLIELSGTDKNRSFSNHLTNNSDFKINNHNVEFICDYSNAWYNKGTIVLRGNKLINLQKSNSYVLAFDVNNFNISLFNAKDVTNYTKEYLKAFNKNVIEFNISENNIMFYKLTCENISKLFYKII